MIKRILHSMDEVNDFFNDFNLEKFSFDTETKSKNSNPQGALRYTELLITGISFCDGKKSCYIPINSKYNLKKVKCVESKELFNMLNDKVFLTKEKGKDRFIICHNIIFDMMVLAKYGVDVEDASWFDTLVAVHLLDENLPEKGLKALTRNILQKEVVDFNEAGIDHYTRKFYDYGLDDAINTWELYFIFSESLTKKDLDDLFYNIEMPFQRCLLEMKIEGVDIDKEKVKEITNELKQSLIDIQKDMYKILGKKFAIQADIFGNILSVEGDINFSSSDQVGDILFNQLKLPVVEYTPKGAPATGKQTIKTLSTKHPFPEKLYIYKIVQKLLSGFFEPLPKFIEKDGKVRTNFRDTGTRTGRLSSSSPNCIEENIEVLVKGYGWKKGKDVVMSDEIATFNKSKSCVEFQKPNKLFKGSTEHGFRFNNTHIDLICTNNHRHLFIDRVTSKYRTRDSEHFLKDAKVLNAAKYIVEKPEDSYIQKLIIAIQADGHIIKPFNHIDFSFIKKRKYDRLLDILNSLNIKYRDYTNSNRYRLHVILNSRIMKKVELYMNLDNKEFYPNIIDKFDDTAFKELRYWDGLSTREFGERYCSMNENNVDTIQALCTLRGYRSLKSICKRRVSVTNRNYSLTANINISRTGPFNYWCASVDNDTLLVRSNGKVIVTNNCQQLPKKNDKMPVETRSCFVAPKGYKLIALDYNSQELRVMTEISRDQGMIDAFNNNEDLHLSVANKAFNLNIPNEYLVTTNTKYEETKKKFKKDRSAAKAVNFGILYGIGPQGLSKWAECSEKEAQKFIDDYFKAYPAVKEAMDKCSIEVNKNGFVRNIFGRYRHFEKIDNTYYPKRVFRQAFNYLIQGASADMIRIAAIDSYKLSKQNPEWGLKMIMTVHDEIVFKVKEEFAKIAATKLKEIFENVIKLVVPIEADVEIGDNYSEVK